MTTLDRSLPATPLLMVKINVPVRLPALPEGYLLEENPESRKEEWKQLMVELGFFDTLQQAESVWNAMESNPVYTIHDQFCMVNDCNGNLAAVCALWPGNDFDSIPLRIHYIGTSPAHQKKGLAQYVLTVCLQKSIRHGMEKVYLSTQVQSWPAILLYNKLGFQPWTSASLRYSREENEKAWQEAAQIMKNQFESDPAEIGIQTEKDGFIRSECCTKNIA